jgi:hypothetical protein
MNRRRGWRVWLAGLAAGLVLGGGGGCFGRPSGSGDAAPQDLERHSLPLGISTLCREGVTTEVALDSASELGFTPASILAFAEGEKSERRVVPAGTDPDGPPVLHVEVEALDEAARAFVPAQGIVGHGLRCDPWLELAVRVAVETSDGALDARFDATLFALHADVAILYARSDGVDLQLLLSPHGVSARLWDDATPDFGDGEPTERYAAPDCAGAADGDFSLPLDAEHHGVSALRLLERMDSVDALDVLWADGARSGAIALFQDVAEHACLAVSSGVPGVTTLRVAAEVVLVTDDGRFAGLLPGMISADSDPTRAPDSPYFWIDAEAFAATKMPGLGFTQYADRTDLDLELWCSIQLDAADQVTGDLALRERPADFCEPGLSGGLEPCSGELITLESATLANPD